MEKVWWRAEQVLSGEQGQMQRNWEVREEVRAGGRQAGGEAGLCCPLPGDHGQQPPRTA